MTAQNHDLAIISELEQSIDILTRGHTPIELLCKKGLNIFCGYFDNRDKAVATALAHNGKSEVYITLNRVDVHESRIKNKVESNVSRSSNDDMIKRHWLFIDVDPVRKTNTQATEYQRQYSQALAKTIIDDFIDIYQWPKPLLADSGNGAHILFPINLQCNDKTDELIHDVMQAIKMMYEEDGFKIDTSTGDRARQIRLHGTINTKGIGDVRKSTIVEKPSSDRYVTVEQLEFYARHNGYKFGGRAMAPMDFDVDKFLRDHKIKHRKREGTNTIRWFVECPNNPDHNTDGKPAILHYKSQGTYGFKCHHDSCSETGIYEYIKKYSPEEAEAIKNVNKSLSKQYTTTIDGYIDAIRDMMDIGSIDTIRYDTFTSKTIVGDNVKTPFDIVVSSVNNAMNRVVKGTRFPSIDLTKRAMEFISYDKQFDSAIDWANSLKWDGVPRLSRFFIDVYQADDMPSVEAMTKEFFTGIMRRVFWPGAILDECLLILGPQGVGKSKGIQLLGGPFFAEYSSDPTKNVDYAAASSGRILIEFSEAASFRNMNNNDKKSFISRNYDSYRKHYTHDLHDAPRRYGIVITSNRYQILNDFTGERRYWVISLPHKSNRDYNTINARFKYISDNRDQIWAEAAHYALNSPMYKNADGFVVAEKRDTDVHDMQMEIAMQQSAHKSVLGNPMMETIVDILESYPEKNGNDVVIGSVLLSDIVWCYEQGGKRVECFTNIETALRNIFDIRTPNNEQRRTFTSCMKELGFSKAKTRGLQIGKDPDSYYRVFVRELENNVPQGYIPSVVVKALNRLDEM